MKGLEGKVFMISVLCAVKVRKKISSKYNYQFFTFRSILRGTKKKILPAAL